MDLNYGLTPELVALVKKEEGWVPHVYECPAGYPTIGWGHKLKPGEEFPDEITQIEGERLLFEDLRWHRDAALRLSPGLKDEPERRLAAITDLCYNVGPTAYGKSHLRTEVNEKNWGKAATNFKTWVWYTDPDTGKRSRHTGLIRRRGIAAEWLK